MDKVAVYVDAGPFQDGIRGLGASLHLGMGAFLRALVPDGEVEAIHYVLAEYPSHPYPTRHRNESALLQTLESDGIDVHLCRTQVIGSIFVERGVEAMLASLMIRAAYEERFDRALLVSRRAELIPVAQAVRAAGKRLDVAFFDFHREPPNPLAPHCDQAQTFSRADLDRF